jgi:YesN/AraC family two-component response regulator
MNEKKPSILIVEDEFLPGVHLKTVLAKEGHHVLGPATTAVDAERIALESRPEIILMDIRLAGHEDGIELARKLRETYEVAIIFMSGYQESIFKDRAMAVSPLAFLIKPVLLRDLKAVIERYRAP